MKILIIEDERTLADSLKVMLTSKGFETDAVYDGESGEQYAALDIYDLVILDIMLPGQNGYQVAKNLRKKHISVPILMLTAKSDIEDKVKGLDSGADYYLTKPFNIEVLQLRVKKFIEWEQNNHRQFRQKIESEHKDAQTTGHNQPRRTG